MSQTEAPLMLSVSGLRGIVGQSLTDQVAARYAAAFGKRLRAHAGQKQPVVIVGQDSRPSGKQLVIAAASGLKIAGCAVRLAGVLSTPGVAVLIKHLKADGGLVVTASHNPSQWNGLKLLRDDGIALPADEVSCVIELFKQDHTNYTIDTGRLEPVDNGAQIHVDRIIHQVNVPVIARTGLRVVVDSVCGAGGLEASLLLKKLGVHAIMLHTEPTGQFPHTPEPTRENLAGLCDAVKREGVAIGFAQDPDADRLAIVDEHGHYIGEEYTLALAAWQVLEAHAQPTTTAAANLSTSRMIDDVAKKFGARVVRTAVGEANVATAMQAHSAIIGGEGNGGVIWPTIGFVRNSLAGIALVLELMARTGKPLSELVASIPSYAIVKDKLPIRPGLADAAIAALRNHFAQQRIDLQDGIRIDWVNKWAHVRPSNTEPIMRIIAEAPTEVEAKTLADDTRDVITSL